MSNKQDYPLDLKRAVSLADKVIKKNIAKKQKLADKSIQMYTCKLLHNNSLITDDLDSKKFNYRNFSENFKLENYFNKDDAKILYDCYFYKNSALQHACKKVEHVFDVSKRDILQFLNFIISVRKNKNNFAVSPIFFEGFSNTIFVGVFLNCIHYKKYDGERVLELILDRFSNANEIYCIHLFRALNAVALAERVKGFKNGRIVKIVLTCVKKLDLFYALDNSDGEAKNFPFLLKLNCFEKSLVKTGDGYSYDEFTKYYNNALLIKDKVKNNKNFRDALINESISFYNKIIEYNNDFQYLHNVFYNIFIRRWALGARQMPIFNVMIMSVKEVEEIRKSLEESQKDDLISFSILLASTLNKIIDFMIKNDKENVNGTPILASSTPSKRMINNSKYVLKLNSMDDIKGTVTFLAENLDFDQYPMEFYIEQFKIFYSKKDDEE